METKLKKLDQSMEKYQSIQEKQITSFDTELMPDLESLNFERATVFADLKNNLDLFLNIIHYEGNRDLMVSYQKRLNKIIKTDEILKDRISRYKDELKQHMYDTNKGKTAFHGYAKSARAIDPKTICFTG